MSALDFMMLVLLMLSVLYGVHQVRRDIARLRCEFDGHSPAVFKRFGDVGRCPRCGQQIATRPPEAAEDDRGMQLGPDTLHQRIARIESALRIEGD